MEYLPGSLAALTRKETFVRLSPISTSVSCGLSFPRETYSPSELSTVQLLNSRELLGVAVITAFSVSLCA